MYVVDTCGWIEWFTDGMLADQFGPLLRETDQLLVPTLVQYELFKWCLRERGEAAAFDLVATTRCCTTIVLDTSIALLAAEVSAAHRLAMADAVIYASARTYGVTLFSSDAHFERLPDVVYWRK